jgi:copper chaperone CopZ
MKKILPLIALLGFIPAVSAREIVLSVNGLVCAFCANGIAATAERHAAVAEVTVDLDNALARFVVKPGATLDADGAKKIIDQAGYEAAAVTLIDQSTSANLTRLATLAGVPLPAPAT